MSSTVRVNMRLCGKTHLITVIRLGEDEFECRVETDCVNIRQFAEGLERVRTQDLTDQANSGIIDRYRKCRMSANCLASAGLISAGWMEVGMISRNCAKREQG